MRVLMHVRPNGLMLTLAAGAGIQDLDYPLSAQANMEVTPTAASHRG
jgi:hypothetical protein